ncbi:acyl-CoA dehydrogenase family protein [Novosphingobium sp. FSW06-99]|uniref:acyl-CoA dehydrogenase family protein n=1 Tax=Novosphingobium sp. FSW06-99 TaxID=1739113 RepID=UPI00076D63A7|nr:acyl-CoA dehydrogenase family protein [Novosphingobium sp. FSW06-99]KUR74928.1 acyl-CoA dehydrogenase [Novosphingobium sp. FSW06-99]
MPLYHTEDQAMLAETVTGFIADEGAIKTQLRRLRDSGDSAGYDPALWAQFAEMGLTGILVSEADGGLGLGHVEAGIVLREIGRNLTPSPFLSTAVVGATALGAASDDLKGRYLPGVIAGKQVLALAIDEGAKHRPERIGLRAERAGNGFRLTGAKQFVVHGATADALIVAARTAGSDSDDDGVTLFAVPRDAAGIGHNAVRLVDSAIASHVTFDGVDVDGGAVIGEVDGGRALLNQVLAAGRIGAAAELTGVGIGAFARTTDYLKTRKQFGKLIGEFQALQHRAAHLYAELEIADAAVIKTQQLLDGGSSQADLMVSVAKAKASRATNLAVREGVQMHGGVGMTDEFDIGLFMKRDRALAEFLGDASYHADRVATLSGY